MDRDGATEQGGDAADGGAAGASPASRAREAWDGVRSSVRSARRFEPEDVERIFSREGRSRAAGRIRSSRAAAAAGTMGTAARQVPRRARTIGPLLMLALAATTTVGAISSVSAERELVADAEADLVLAEQEKREAVEESEVDPAQIQQQLEAARAAGEAVAGLQSRYSGIDMADIEQAVSDDPALSDPRMASGDGSSTYGMVRVEQIAGYEQVPAQLAEHVVPAREASGPGTMDPTQPWYLSATGEDGTRWALASSYTMVEDGVELLWLDRAEDGVLLAWATGTWSSGTGKISDFTVGTTTAGTLARATNGMETLDDSGASVGGRTTGPTPEDVEWLREQMENGERSLETGEGQESEQ